MNTVELLGTFSHMSDVTDRANYANMGDMYTTKNFARTHALEHDYSESKDGSARRRSYFTLHKTVGRTEFYQAKTVKTHSNNLVVLAHVQLKPFYCLSTRDVTHVRKCTPALSRFTVLQATGSWAGGWERG